MKEPIAQGPVDVNVRPACWPLTVEGRQCHCNYCYKQFQSREEFSKHWKECPTRIRFGYIEQGIYAA